MSGSVNIPIGANASGITAAFDQIREAIKRSGQEAKAFRDVDLSHPELTEFAADLTKVRQQMDDLLRLGTGRTAATARRIDRNGGLNPFSGSLDQQFDAIFPDPAERARVRQQLDAYLLRETRIAPVPGQGLVGPMPAPTAPPLPSSAGSRPGRSGRAEAGEGDPDKGGLFDTILGSAKGFAKSIPGQLLGLAGIDSLASMAGRGYHAAVGESQANDALMRSVGDPSTDFYELRDAIRGAVKGLGILDGQAQAMAMDWARAGAGNNAMDGVHTLADRVAMAAGMARGYGMAPEEMNAAAAGTYKNGLAPQDFANMIAEAVADGGMSGDVGRAVKAISAWTESSNRAGVGVNSAKEFTDMFAAFTGSGNTGLYSNAEGIISQMDAAIKGGAGGLAGQAMLYRAFAANGVTNPYTVSRLTEKGMFGHVHDDGTGPTIYEAVREQIRKQYSGNSPEDLERLDNAMGRMFGTGAEVQRQIRLNVKPGNLGRFGKLLSDAGVSERDINPTAYGDLARIASGDVSLSAMREKMVSGNDYHLSDEEKGRLKGLSGDALKQEIVRLIASHGGQETEATRQRNASAGLSNALSENMAKLIPAVTGMSSAAATLTTAMDKLVDLMQSFLTTGPSTTSPAGNNGDGTDQGNQALKEIGMSIAYRGPSFRSMVRGGMGGYGGGGGGGGDNTPLPAGEAAARAQQAFSYFKGQGWTDEQAAGLVSSIEKESGFRTNAVGDSGMSGGIGQWNHERRARFAAMFGHDVTQGTYEEQLQYMQWELTHTEKAAGDLLRGQTTAYGAGAAVSSGYERPRDRAGEMAGRGHRADQLLPGLQQGGAGGNGAGFAGGAHVVHVIAPLRVVVEDKNGRVLRTHALPVTSVAHPHPYGTPHPALNT